MKIEKGTTYWGYIGNKETHRLVNIIETRNSGNQYVHWTTVKKNGEKGKSGWTRIDKFAGWVHGVFEYGEDTQP